LGQIVIVGCGDGFSDVPVRTVLVAKLFKFFGFGSFLYHYDYTANLFGNRCVAQKFKREYQ
jgi:hypothetical protein